MLAVRSSNRCLALRNCKALRDELALTIFFVALPGTMTPPKITSFFLPSRPDAEVAAASPSPAPASAGPGDSVLQQSPLYQELEQHFARASGKYGGQWDFLAIPVLYRAWHAGWERLPMPRPWTNAVRTLRLRMVPETFLVVDRGVVRQRTWRELITLHFNPQWKLSTSVHEDNRGQVRFREALINPLARNELQLRSGTVIPNWKFLAD